MITWWKKRRAVNRILRAVRDDISAVPFAHGDFDVRAWLDGQAVGR